MLFANTRGRTNQIRTEFYKNGDTQTFLYYKEKPQEICKGQAAVGAVCGQTILSVQCQN